VFPSWEDEDGGVGRVGSSGVGASDGVLHGAAHTFVIVFRISDVNAMLSVWCVITAR
jgi:hypothetical protein